MLVCYACTSPVDCEQAASKSMQHRRCIWVLHPQGVASDGQALPEHRLSAVL